MNDAGPVSVCFAHGRRLIKIYGKLWETGWRLNVALGLHGKFLAGERKLAPDQASTACFCRTIS
jgi:hypothetical protein